MTRLNPAGAVALVLVMGACDSGPEGPGTLDVVLTGPPDLGAVVLEVTGAGIDGFVGQGDTEAFGAEASSGSEGKHRVVLVDRTGADFHFGIRVRDLGAERPVVTVVNSANTSNLPTVPTGIEVRIEG